MTEVLNNNEVQSESSFDHTKDMFYIISWFFPDYKMAESGTVAAVHKVKDRSLTFTIKRSYKNKETGKITISPNVMIKSVVALKRVSNVISSCATVMEELKRDKKMLYIKDFDTYEITDRHIVMTTDEIKEKFENEFKRFTTSSNK